MAHSHNRKIMFELATEAILQIKGHAAPGAKLTFYTPSFQFSNIYEFLVKIARYLIMKADSQYGPTTIRLYSFRNSLRPTPFFNFIDLPSEVFVFLEKARIGEMNRNLDELFNNSSVDIYRRLIEGVSIKLFFIRLKERKIVGGWDLFELYLTEVEKMEKERLEVVKKVGKRLYEHLKNTNFKRLADIEGAEKYGEFRLTLTKIQKETLIWEIDDEPLLFPQDKEGVTRWKETQAILLAFLYEQMHKDNIRPKEV